jgi:hypothetical protein
MKTKIWLLCVMILAFSFSACAAAAPTPIAAAAPAAPAAAAPALKVDRAPEQGVQSKQIQAANSPAKPETVVKRIVIKNAVLSLIVKEPAQSMARISKMADQMGGFVIQSNIKTEKNNEGIDYPEASISIRVPAERLLEAIETIKNETGEPGKGVLNEQITGSDVTQEYTDLQSRLTNLNNASDQLKSIMVKAEKTEDVLAVYNQLKDVNEQIEVIKGQIKFYEQASNLSEINITLTSADSIKPITIAGWEPVGVARDALQTLVHALQGLTTMVIWVILFLLPFILVIGLLFFILFMVIRKITKTLHKK